MYNWWFVFSFTNYLVPIKSWMHLKLSSMSKGTLNCDFVQLIKSLCAITCMSCGILKMFMPYDAASWETVNAVVSLQMYISTFKISVSHFWYTMKIESLVCDSDFCRSKVKIKYTSGFVIPILDLLLIILWLIWHLLSEYIVIAEGLYFRHC